MNQQETGSGRGKYRMIREDAYLKIYLSNEPIHRPVPIPIPILHAQTAAGGFMRMWISVPPFSKRTSSTS